MSPNKSYSTLLLCTISAFLITLLVYVLIEGRNPLNRIAYAVFMSVVPAIASAIAVRVFYLPRILTVLVYASLFALILILQGVLRNV